MTTHSQTPTPQAQPAPSQTPASSPPANPADVTTIESTVAALYDVISGPAGKRNWDRFRSLFIPGARLIPTGRRQNSEVGSRVLTVEDYVQRAGTVARDLKGRDTTAYQRFSSRDGGACINAAQDGDQTTLFQRLRDPRSAHG